MSDEKARTCGECVFWEPSTRSPEFGDCFAPIPEWAVDELSEVDPPAYSHDNNAAVVCGCFSPKDQP